MVVAETGDSQYVAGELDMPGPDPAVRDPIVRPAARMQPGPAPIDARGREVRRRGSERGGQGEDGGMERRGGRGQEGL